MSRLLIVSNRLPVNITRREGKLRSQPSAGGLATGLGSFYKLYKSLWIGWSGIDPRRIRGEEEEVKKILSNEGCHPVFLSQYQVENYYDGFCNKTIWPLFHYFTQYTVYNKSLWEVYKRVNEIFCEAVVEVAKNDDIIWVHDYHLMLLPRLIRERLKKATIGFFLHIPFPSFEVFRLLPWRGEIVDGLLGADLIGFHTYDYVQHFLDSVHHLSGYEHSLNQIFADSRRIVRADAFPMGIAYERFSDAVGSSKVKREIEKIRKKTAGSKVILSIDRLDYTKGILQRLEAFDIFLEKNPEYRERVTLIMVAVPSRTRVEEYVRLKKQVDELIGKINGKYGTIGWIPVWYLWRFLNFDRLVALYNIADIALVTPLRDGMNLIAKEFVTTKTDGKGVLVLSEMTGAAKELGEAIIVNPNNKEEIAAALKEALLMPEEEQIERNKQMQNRLQRYNVVRWANDFMDRLGYVKKLQHNLSVRRLTHGVMKSLIEDYIKSKRRLLLLDYDGTMVPFREKPERAKPDDELLKLLKDIASKNEVVIISGRDKDTLDRWFGQMNMGLIAEHGVWIKEKRGVWEMIEPLKNDWKDEVRPILEVYVDRTPGAFIEEKEFSLVWHYRKVDPELASLRARELKDALLHLTANLNLGVLEGRKIIEIKNIGVDKGRAALRWLLKRDWDFILSVGDDRTDEDIFNVLPEEAYSVKVGPELSRARFYLETPQKVRKLLEELIKAKR